MPRCREIPDLASDYLDCNLAFHQRVAMRLHLSVCAACRAYMAQMRRTIGLLRHIPPRPPGPEIEDIVLSAIHARPPRPPG